MQNPPGSENAMNLSQIKATVKVGDVFDVTNHYITREDHPCYGTRRVTVTKVTSSSFHFNVTAGDRGGDSRIEWPKASQVGATGNMIQLRGGGVSQEPQDLFLTLLRVAEETTLDSRITDAVMAHLEDATNGQTVDALDSVIARLTLARDRAQTVIDAACIEDDEPSDEFCEGYSTAYYGTEPPTYTDPNDVAEFRRGLAAGEARTARESHPEHDGCADGCGLDVTHDGACLDKPGGRELCAHFACPTCDTEVILLALPGGTATRTGWFHTSDETPMHGIEPWVGSPPVGALEAARRL